jgi:hypothetical protein
MRYPTDGTPVRPGTSDALTARTIDATVHPPLVRAQETVAAIGPRIAQSVVPLTSPLFLGLVAITLMFVLVARRLRYRPSALVLSALLVMGLTSFRPLQKWEQPKRAAVRPKTVSRAMRPHYWNAVPAIAAPSPVEIPDDSQEPVMLPSVPVPPSPEGDVGVEVMRATERMMHDERVREILGQLQYRLREEARSRRWRRIVAKYKARNRDFDQPYFDLTR